MAIPQNILVTGGTGYMGSHTVVEVMAAGYAIFIIDNLCNSKASVLDRIERIAGRRPGFEQTDVRDRPRLCRLFANHRFDAVIHFAGLKAVGESVGKPLAYYDNNVGGSVTLFECMMEAGLRTIVFSSSATVYGEPASVPIREDFPLSPDNPALARKALGWQAQLGLEAMCADTGRWQQSVNPIDFPIGDQQ